MAGGGVVTVGGNVYLADRRNHLGAELDGFTAAKVAISEADEVSGSFAFSTDSGATLPGQRSPIDQPVYQTFLAPFLTVSYPDSTQPGGVFTVTRQVGLYILLPSTREHSPRSSAYAYQAMDLTWLVQQDSFGFAKNVAAGTNYAQAVRDLLNGMNLTRNLIAATTKTLPKARSWKIGTPKLTIVNDLLAEAGFWPLWADTLGRLVSRQMNTVDGSDPIAAFSSAAGDIVETVQVEPDLSLVANKIIVIGADPNHNSQDDPITATRLNTRADSPTSTVSLGEPGYPLTMSRVIEDVRIVDQDAADRRATTELAKATRAMTRFSLKTVPNPLVEFRQPVTLDITRDDGTVIAAGSWAWDQLTLGFTPGDGAMAIRCAKLLPFGEAT